MTPEEVYEACTALARKSPCQKLGFGAVLIHKPSRSLVAEAFNSPLLPLADMCEGECIRFHIRSRTRSMIGACAHAEEICISKAVVGGLGAKLRYCELFVRGWDPQRQTHVNGTGDRAAFTCIRCATQMYLYGILGVNVWFGGEWHFVPSEKALEQAKLYAMGALEVTN